jgi:hypothetical protein
LFLYRWYIQVPVLFGVGCQVFAAGLIVSRTLRPIEQPQPRPWYYWHSFTWLAFTLVASGILLANSLPYVTALHSEVYWRWGRGWPATAREVIQTERDYTWQGRDDPDNQIRWNVFSVALNLTAAALILASTAYACETWRRSGLRRMQFNLGFILALITIVPILTWAHNHFDTGLYRWLRQEMPWLPKYAYYDWLDEFPWALSAVLLFGECCLLYASGAVLGRGWMWLRKRLFGE